MNQNDEIRIDEDGLVVDGELMQASWGNILDDDVLVWIPHALCRHSAELKLTFEDIGFIVQCFSFRGKQGIFPSETTLMIRGGYSTRNPIINKIKTLVGRGYLVKRRRRSPDGVWGSNLLDFSPLRKKLENLVKSEWELGKRSPRKHSIHVDAHQHGASQHGAHQHDERQQEKPKVLEPQGISNPDGNSNRNQEPSSVSGKEQKQDIDKKKFSTYRKQLKGEQLEAFELIADNLEKVVGKTCLELVQQSPEAVKSAYAEMVERDKKHFSYFTKVFFTHLKQGGKTDVGTTVDYDAIDETIYHK